MTFAAIAAPKVIAWILPLQAVVIFSAFPENLRPTKWTKQVKAIAITCALFAIDALLSAGWSRDKSATLTAASLLIVYLCSAWLSLEGLERESYGIVRRLGRVVVIATIAGAVFLGFELLTDSYIQRILFTNVPILRPSSPEHVGMLNGRVAFLAPDEMNAGIAILNLLLWSSLLLLSTQFDTHRTKLVSLGVFTLVAGVTFLSSHATSKIAIVSSAIVFAAFGFHPHGARVLVYALWIAATVLVVPAVHLAYQRNLYTADWLPANGRARIIIWDATAERVGEAPLLGVGAASTKSITQSQPGEERPHHTVRWHTGAHAHNIYLQTWYELGVTGAAILLALGLSIVSWITRLPNASQRFVLSTFVSAAVLGAFSWGLWQPWLLASFCFTSVLTALAVSEARVGGATGSL